jgi:hypothetical protein
MQDQESVLETGVDVLEYQRWYPRGSETCQVARYMLCSQGNGRTCMLLSYGQSLYWM